MSSKIAILSILLLALQGHPINAKEKYTITQLDNNEVIYLETLSQVKLYHEQWKLVIGYDLLDLEANYNILRNTYVELNKRCFFQIDNRNLICSSKRRINQRIDQFKEIANDVENVLHLAGLQRSVRTKRGLFDFIGEISKTLFGTLDDTDATYYNEELDKLYADQKNVIQYVKNQTSIILKTLTSSKKIIDTASNSISRIDDQFNRLKNLSQINEANIWIDEALLDLDDELRKLTNEIKRMDELITDARHGTVKPYVLSPKELFNVLREHKHIDNFPVPLEEKYYTTLVDISDISIALTEKRLLVQFLIPLIEDKILELTKVISLPRHGWLRQSIVDTTQRLILLDPMRTIFMPINELELNSARKLGKYQLLKRTYPDYKVGIRDNCLTEIITKRDSEKCTTKYMQIQNTLWVQLHTNQDWIGIAPREELLHILCSDKIPRKARIYQNFILHIEPDCTATSDTATLRPENLAKHKIEIHKTIHLADQKSINKTFSEHQLTDIPMDLIKETHINPEHLQVLGKTLDELDDIADQISKHKRTITWKEQFMYYLHLTGYIALGSILFIFLYKIGLFSSIINLFKQLIGNCYNQCSFGNRAPTQHAYYTNRAPNINHDLDLDVLRRLVHNKI